MKMMNVVLLFDFLTDECAGGRVQRKLGGRSFSTMASPWVSRESKRRGGRFRLFDDGCYSCPIDSNTTNNTSVSQTARSPHRINTVTKVETEQRSWYVCLREHVRFSFRLSFSNILIFPVLIICFVACPRFDFSYFKIGRERRGFRNGMYLRQRMLRRGQIPSRKRSVLRPKSIAW